MGSNVVPDLGAGDIVREADPLLRARTFTQVERRVLTFLRIPRLVCRAEVQPRQAGLQG